MDNIANNDNIDNVDNVDNISKVDNSIISGKKIGFCITASFCTLADIMNPLKTLVGLGADIYPIVSQAVASNSSRFHDKDEFLGSIVDITGNELIQTSAQAEPLGPKNPMDLIIIAPTTGNTLAKIANGIWEGAVPMATKATLRNNKPILIAITTNDALGTNGVNLMKLYNSKNIYFVPFGQDDPINKPNSMAADLSKLVEAATAALHGKQLQPAII